MPNKSKIDVVEKIKEVIEKYPDFFITENKGLNVADITELRAKLRENGAVYQIFKNNLFKIALNNSSISGLDQYLVGPNAFLFADDPVSAAKAIKDFIKDKTKKNKLEIKAGYSEGKVINKEYIEALSSLPSKEELLSKLLGTLTNPLSRLVKVLSNPLQKLAFVLSAIAEKK